MPNHEHHKHCNILTCECCETYVPQRWLGSILSSLAIIASYCMRVSTHLAIVRMVKNTTKAVSKSNCKAPDDVGSKKKVTYGENDWSQSTQSWILSGFYMGYIPFHLPAGALSDKFGSRWVLSTGILVCIVCTFLIPVSTDYIGYVAVIILRIIQGAGQGVLYPSITAFLGRWTPKEERSLATSIALSGTAIGSIVGILATGMIMVFFDNWRAPFYIWAFCSILLYIALIFYMYSDPRSHPNITAKEYTYLDERMVAKIKKKIPYVKISTDGAVISGIMGQMGHVIILFFFSSNMPKYMDNVLRYPITNNALVSSVPYVGTLIVSVCTAKFADWGIKKMNWNLGCTRKLLTLVSTMLSGLFVLAVGYCGCNGNCVIIMFVFAMATKGAYYAGLKSNTLDLTTQYAGFVTAITNGLGAIVGLTNPIIIAAMAPNNTIDEWIPIFWLLCSVSTITSFIFLFMGSGIRRRWDYSKEDQKYFVGKVKCFSLWDGPDIDKEAIDAGRLAEASINNPAD